MRKKRLLAIVAIFLCITMSILNVKGFYRARRYQLKDIYLLFEGVFIASFLAGIISILINHVFGFALILLNIFITFAGISLVRLVFVLYKTFFKRSQNAHLF